ncbi:MAG: hypothetical protein AB1465_04780 [Patescibacteria group bacterium]
MPNKNTKTQESLLIKQLLRSAQKQIEEAARLFERIENGQITKEDESTAKKIKTQAGKLKVIEEGKIIEGVFDGQNMQGPDGKTYPVPPNYASKSKLVEGDTMKLTIMPDGSFRFKQIAPIERKRMIGQVILQDDQLVVEAEGKIYKILNASASYYKVSQGDKVTVVIPQKRKAIWCAIENVIKKKEIDNVDKIEAL